MFRRPMLGFIAGFLITVPLTGYCQMNPSAPQTDQSVPAGKANPVHNSASSTTLPYLLAAEDVIDITVINFNNLSTQVTIPPDGKIAVPLLKPFSVAGKTTEEIAHMLTEMWRKYVINPSVTVSLRQKRRQENILLYGNVLRPGTVEYRPTVRLLTALAEVGGALPNGDLSRVTLTRLSGQRSVLDLRQPETKAGTEEDIALERGDVIYVPELRVQVTVVGEVNNPGSFDYQEEMTVLNALTAAGGVRSETSNLAEATLIHEGKEQKLDLERLLRQGDLSMNIKLAPGDRIMIPELRNRTYVFGAVGRPGYYLFKPGDRILDALNGSGGPIRGADLGRVNHIRIDKAKNTATVTAINVEKFLKKGDLKENIALEAGDVLFIPDKKRGFQIQDLFGILSGLNIIDTAARIFTQGLGQGVRGF